MRRFAEYEDWKIEAGFGQAQIGGRSRRHDAVDE
jgi:hypothetical protein